jgi:hypothetical protein
MDKLLRKELLLRLCKYFRLDYEEIEAIDELKMLYIHSSILELKSNAAINEILQEIDALDIHFRNRRRNLNTIYYHIKMNKMLGSGRYDTSPSKPPIHFWRFDDY